MLRLHKSGKIPVLNDRKISHNLFEKNLLEILNMSSRKLLGRKDFLICLAEYC